VPIQLLVLTLVASTAIAAAPRAWAHAGQTQLNHIRIENERILEIFRFALHKSDAFQDLVATLEQQDRIVYVEEGSCRHVEVSGCVAPMPTPGGKHLLVLIDPRQSINRASAQLAHELYHASEIARYPDAIDVDSVRQLYARIGRRTCAGSFDDCWETSAALTFERLVWSELSGKQSPTTKPSR
jgi:hypothetical protein